MEELLQWIEKRMMDLEQHAAEAAQRKCCPDIHASLGEVYLLRAEVMRRLEAEGAVK